MNFSDVFYLYRIVILEFLFEFSVFFVLATHRLERRERFWLRLTGGLALIALCGLPVAWFYTAFGNTLWGRTLTYGFLFALFVALAKFCYKESLWKTLFCASIAYAAQNLTYKLFLLFWTTGEIFHLYDTWIEHFNVWYRVVYYSFFALCAAAIYFCFLRRIVRSLSKNDLNYKMFALTASVLAITVVLCSIEDIYFAEFSVGMGMERETQYPMTELYVIRQTGNLFSAICCSIVLLFASMTLERRELLQEVEYLKYSIRQGQKQYEISKDTIDLINVKCHDIKYKIESVLAQHTEISSKDLEELQKSIRIYDSNVETGNQLLNVFLTDKSLYCEQNGINLSCMIDGKELDFIEAGDLYCLFGNIVDNALESVVKLSDKEKRVINLTVKRKNGMLMIQSENYFQGELTFRDGLPVTTKNDKDYHGFGLQSVKMIVKKYGGELTTHATDDIFHLNVLFASHSGPN